MKENRARNGIEESGNCLQTTFVINKFFFPRRILTAENERVIFHDVTFHHPLVVVIHIQIIISLISGYWLIYIYLWFGFWNTINFMGGKFLRLLGFACREIFPWRKRRSKSTISWIPASTLMTHRTSAFYPPHGKTNIQQSQIGIHNSD